MGEGGGGRLEDEQGESRETGRKRGGEKEKEARMGTRSRSRKEGKGLKWIRGPEVEGLTPPPRLFSVMRVNSAYAT
jgi:hypothetical protein